MSNRKQEMLRFSFNMFSLTFNEVTLYNTELLNMTNDIKRTQSFSFLPHFNVSTYFM